MPLTVLVKAPTTLRTSKKIYRLNAGDVLELTDVEAAEIKSGRVEGAENLYVVEDTSVAVEPPASVEVPQPVEQPQPQPQAELPVEAPSEGERPGRRKRDNAS
jgi:hypothetical protein